MAEAERYVVVDTTAMTIIGGPYKWDGVTAWIPPEDGTLMLETDAIEQGYHYPPDPAAEAPAEDPADVGVGGPVGEDDAERF
jgi:hypothetical protein